MSDKICSVDGCGNKINAKTLCMKHYHRFKRYGNPLFSFSYENDKVCSIDGCFNKRSAKGLCSHHYQKRYKHGDPLWKKPTNISLCSIEGCSNISRSLGMCDKHYTRYKITGSPLNVNRERYPEKHGMSYTSEYSVWHTMIQRCINKKAKGYMRYGGRGITVCDRWRNSFIDFYEDMGQKPFPKAQIDRIENDGNYEPGNCEWVSNTYNMRHTSTVKLSIDKVNKIKELLKLKSYTQKEIGEIFGVSATLISNIKRNKVWVSHA